MSVATQSNIVNSIILKRDTRSGLNLPGMQGLAIPANLKTELSIIPATSTPNFGSVFICDIKDRNILLNDLTLQFNVSAISGLTGGTNLRWLPSYFWATKIELLINNVTIDTLYPHAEYILNNICFHDEDRIFRNNLAGNYASITQRNALATTSTSSNIYLNLKSFVDQCNIPLLTENHALQLRITLDSLANLYSWTNAYTGTASATINFVNLIAKVTRLDPNIALARLTAMRQKPENYFYHSLRYSPFTVQSGVSTSTTVLTPIVGNVAALFFFFRTASALTGANDATFKYTAPASFNLLDSTGASMVGGQVIPYQVAVQYLQQYLSRSSFASENAIGSNLAGTVVDNGVNVIMWSFSQDLPNALTYGQALGSRRFVGSEQLILNYTAALGANIQLDVYALTETILEVGATAVRTYPL